MVFPTGQANTTHHKTSTKTISPTMKKLISLFFLFFNLILSSPLVVIDAFDPTKAGCLVPEEYCSGDTSMCISVLIRFLES